MNTTQAPNSVFSETQALRRALALLGLDPDRVVQFLQKENPTAIDEHVFGSMELNFQTHHAIACDATAWDMMEIKRQVNELRVGRSMMLPNLHPLAKV